MNIILNIHTGEVKNLSDWLEEHGIIGISGVDTRELVKIIRENKDVVGRISNNIDNIELESISINDITTNTLAENVSMKIIYGVKIIQMIQNYT